jgi:hypothetical protein
VVMFLGIFLIPLPLLGGYGLRLLRGVVKTGEPHLPDWDNLGEMYLDGLAQMVIAIVYMLPLYVLMCCGMVPFFVGPPVLAAAAEDSPALMMGGSALALGVGTLVLGLASLLGILASFVVYVALARYTDTGELGSAFQFRDVWNILKANLGQFVLAFAVYYGLSAGLSFVMQILVYTVVLICVFPFVMVLLAFYMQALLGALYGLAYREAQAKLDAAPSDPAPEPAA